MKSVNSNIIRRTFLGTTIAAAGLTPLPGRIDEVIRISK
jgi:hypothetical protein